MAQKYYLPKNDEAKAALFEHFRDSIAPYSAAFSLTPGTLTAQAADAAYFRWLVTQSAAARGYSQALTAWKDAHRDGSTPATTTAPAPPASAPPALVSPGIVPRFTALIRRLKEHPNYTDAIGEALRIVGDLTEPLDTANAQPDLTGAKVIADTVRIPWKKGGFDGIRLEVDRGSGWAFLAIDTRPDYTDTEPFPASGTLWKYRAIYLLNDEKVGQWSPAVSVRVG